MDGSKKETLLNKSKEIERTVSNAYDELKAAAAHSCPYDAVVQLSLSCIAAFSFVCLSRFVKKYGLRRFLFLDKLCDESETVRATLNSSISLKILFIFVLPCFAVECAYKIWWYNSGGTRIPFLGNVVVSDTVACILELSSWLYRTVVFYLVCIHFQLICYLQILRLQDFAQVFHVDSDVESVLREHLRIRRHLRIISHRYRSYILWALMFITASQFASLLMTTRATADLRIHKSGELALCSDSLHAGLMILLRSATRITHKAQSVTCLAAKWHVCTTIDSFDSTEFSPVCSQGSSDADDVVDEEDELDNTKFIPAYAYSTISFQKRQELGVICWLKLSSFHTIVGLELSPVLWLPGKTIGISLVISDTLCCPNSPKILSPPCMIL
ncbi:unnamed protein product [Withania somnifera]